VKRSALILLCSLAALLGGCAQATFPGTGGSGGVGFALTVTPGTASIAGLNQQQFVAKLGDGTRPASVNWMINGMAGGDATVGTIDANGLYTAPEFPPAVNSVTISATIPTDSRKTGNSNVTLDNPVPVLTAVSPSTFNVGAFTLALTGAHFAQGATVFFGNTALTTTYVSSTQLTATGTATATEAGDVTVTVQNPAPGPSVSAGVIAHVLGGVAVQVTPPTSTVRAGAQQAFAATVSGTTNTAVSWSVNGVVGGNSTVGTIVGNGNYKAPVIVPTNNNITVTATSVADTNASGNAAITLANPAPVLQDLTPITVTTGVAFQLTLTGSGFMSSSVVNFGSRQLSTTYVSPTELTATGTATAAEVGIIPVTVTNPNPGLATSSAINVTVVSPNSNIKVVVSPKTATLGAGNIQQFLATVTGTTDMNVVWSVNNINYGNDSVGNIDGNGNYTAPVNLSSAGTVTIKATSEADPTKSDTATVTWQNPVPTLTAITPGTLATGGFQITLYGTGFVATSVANFGGTALQTTYATSTMITAVGTALTTQVGQVPVKVFNPLPGGGTSNSVNVTVSSVTNTVTPSAAVRFLEQSSFGPNLENVNQVQQLGFDAYLKNQFAATTTPYPDPRLKDGISNIQQTFYLNAVAGGDQLRERATLAFNEFWVVGADKIGDPLGYTNYLRTLGKDALGNYLDLMTDVTLTPAMGHYLDMVDNDAPPPGEHANENYAREIMQLFCLGLVQLNADGTPVLDTSGNPVPTYTQNDVMDLGRAFTGWTYPLTPGKTQQTHNPEYYGGPMAAVESNHDTGAKTILGQAIPAGQNAEQDLASALSIIFNHPNVGPFVAKQMIEHLVTSNPSAGYVQRVAQAFNSGAFNGYGSGKRGDMQATIAAILLDAEARQGDSPATSTATDGKLREPVIMIVSSVRAFHGKTDAAGFSYDGDSMSQNIFYPPTVFNFFPPVNPIAGTTLNGPEFAIFDTNTSLARANYINDLVYGGIGSNTKLDFSPVINAGSPAQMVAWLDTLFLHGSTPDQMKQMILTAINAVDPGNPGGQAQAAIYLYLSSSMYQVQH
jgi:uncharacterized protein (DUF1800 family)